MILWLFHRIPEVLKEPAQSEKDLVLALPLLIKEEKAPTKLR